MSPFFRGNAGLADAQKPLNADALPGAMTIHWNGIFFSGGGLRLGFAPWGGGLSLKKTRGGGFGRQKLRGFVGDLGILAGLRKWICLILTTA